MGTVKTEEVFFYHMGCMVNNCRFKFLYDLNGQSIMIWVPLMATKASCSLFMCNAKHRHVFDLVQMCTQWLTCVDVFFWAMVNSNSPQWQFLFRRHRDWWLWCESEIKSFWDMPYSAQRGACKPGGESCPWNQKLLFVITQCLNMALCCKTSKGVIKTSWILEKKNWTAFMLFTKKHVSLINRQLLQFQSGSFAVDRCLKTVPFLMLLK